NDCNASTTAPAMANRAPIYAIENPALEMERFASILADLSDDLFDHGHRLKDHGAGMITLLARDDMLDNVEFLIGKIYTLAREIGDATTRAVNAHIQAEGTGAVAGGHAINELVASLRGGETASELVLAAVELARKGVAA
ncbi:MAG TPA: hypothetical protein VGN75_13670, partial [Kaistia sp.]|nr:hypothetical protein [Kaistia sp.]